MRKPTNNLNRPGIRTPEKLDIEYSCEMLTPYEEVKATSQSRNGKLIMGKEKSH